MLEFMMMRSLVLCLFLFSNSLWALEGKVLVADPRVDEGKISELELLGPTRGTLRQGADERSIDPISLATPQVRVNCAQSCIAKLAAENEADWVISPVLNVRVNGATDVVETRLTASLYDSSGAMVSVTERSYRGTSLPLDVAQSLFIELLTPTEFAGILAVANVPPLARVFVDGMPISKAKERSIRLRVGSHVVRFIHEGKNYSLPITIGLNENIAVEMPSQPLLNAKTVIQEEVTTTEVGFPKWPTYVAASLTGVASAAAIGFGVAYGIESSKGGYNRTSLDPVEVTRSLEQGQDFRYARQGSATIAISSTVVAIAGVAATTILWLSARE